jgi:hypothetical protein
MSRSAELQLPIRAATETCAAHGFAPDRCDILQDGHTLVLRLSETLVARVVTDRDGPRKGGEWFTRESAVACHLARLGAPVIPMHPAIPPGPHEHLGFTLNFWQFVTSIDEEASRDEIGRTLFHCHKVLREFDGSLPELGILSETLELLDNSTPCPLLTIHDIGLLHQRLSTSLEALRDFPMQALHGDAHGGNLMNTTQGLLWTDWEDTFLGPIEWDLASIVWNARFLENNEASANALLAAYCKAGGEIHETAMHHSQIARAAVMCAWYPILYPDTSSERLEKLRFRLKWLRENE